jgi:hypothetical protein
MDSPTSPAHGSQPDGAPGSLVLILGAGRIDRELADPERLLDRYLVDVGLRYLDYRPITPPDRLVPEDLAVTILVNSRVGWRAFESIQDLGATIDLGTLPDMSLETTTAAEREVLADLIARVAGWPGLAASTATKVLHKKRPGLIPILDNRAIFGAYMNPNWPQQRSRADPVHDARTIRSALDFIATDLTRLENATVWPVLHAHRFERTSVELFDMVWWSYFRTLEPVKPAPTI